MSKKELQEKINNYKPNCDYLYQRHDGEIRKYLLTNNSNSIYIDVKTGITVDISESLLLGKVSENIIDLIEDEDLAVLEYKSPKYRERITRRFEISKIDNDIRFENAHCSFLCKVGDKKIKDKICKNIKIKSIVTKEQFSQIEYKVGE